MAIKSKSALEAMKILGRNINLARRKRKIAIKDFANRIGVSERTVIRLEKGDEGVKVGTLAMALLVLGELKQISEVLEPSTDFTGLLMDQEKLQRRIQTIRNTTAHSLPSKTEKSESNSDIMHESDF